MTIADSISTDFGYFVEYLDGENRVLRDERLNPADFAHAIRHTRFEAFRRGLVETYEPLSMEARIEPLFPNGGSTSPRAKGFGVTVRLADGAEHDCKFDISYFATSANRLRAQLLRTNVMTPDQELYYRLSAYLDDDEPARPDNKLAISLESAARSIAVVEGSREALGRG